MESELTSSGWCETLSYGKTENSQMTANNKKMIEDPIIILESRIVY